MSFALASFGTVSVTNHAGGVLSGELTAVTNGTFTVGGRTLPMKVLPAAEQRRLKVLAGQDVRTAKERQRAKLLDYELRRIDTRLKGGEITETEAAALRADAHASAAFNLKGQFPSSSSGSSTTSSSSSGGAAAGSSSTILRSASGS